MLNGDLEFPLELVRPNKLLLTLLCDIYNLDVDIENTVESYNSLRERIKEDLEEDPNKQHYIPLPGWDIQLIPYLMEFSQYHLNNPLEIKGDELPDWDNEFMTRLESVNPELCGYLFQLANYLHNDSLIDVCAIYFARKLDNCNKEEIRKQFNIKNDFTEEEEKEIEEKTAWIAQHK